MYREAEWIQIGRTKNEGIFMVRHLGTVTVGYAGHLIRLTGGQAHTYGISGDLGVGGGLVWVADTPSTLDIIDRLTEPLTATEYISY